jgi:hypothetical protein
MFQSLILIDALSSACWEKKKRKEKEKWPGWSGGHFPRARGWTHLAD